MVDGDGGGCDWKVYSDVSLGETRIECEQFNANAARSDTVGSRVHGPRRHGAFLERDILIYNGAPPSSLFDLPSLNWRPSGVLV